eukprot:GEMP01020752.1.p1 GENE.GEMP01020752.1~~GEMP01020752.1.p1  ORF type:complete len:342 (-),score=74.98 GEMP01020752.1:1444-2469(-)
MWASASSRAVPRGARGRQDQIQVYFPDNTYRLVACSAETTVDHILDGLRDEPCADSSVAPTTSKVSEYNGHVEMNGLFIVTPGTCALRERRLNAADKPLGILQSSGSAFKFVYKPLVADETEAVVQVEREKGIRRGILEKHSKDGNNWKSRHFVLGVDRIWYWKTPEGLELSRSYLPMTDIEKVMEHPEQKCVLTIVTYKRVYVLRARSFQDRDGWVLALTRQVALVKENALVEQAENAIGSLEREKAFALDEALETLSSYVGTLRFADGTKELFRTFALDTCVDATTRRDMSLFLDQIADGGDPGELDAAWHAMCETTIFPKFQNNHIFQRRLEHLLIKE